MKYRLLIAYRGGGYAGWQRQSNAVAVQQKVEEALAQVLSRKVVIHGSGRTDTGVHAAAQVAHLEQPEPVVLDSLVHGANHFLPEDIRVLRADPIGDDFHARKSAVAKEYRYRMSRCRVLSPLAAPFSIRIDPAVDLDSMRAAAQLLLGRHDFTAFAASGGAHRDPRRRILEAEWLERDEALVFRVLGEGFLRGMVRALAGTLLEVGQGRRTVEQFGELLVGAPRSAAGPNAPPHGLVLWQVFYPPELTVPGEATLPSGQPGSR